jgi:hypothetical protein
MGYENSTDAKLDEMNNQKLKSIVVIHLLASSSRSLASISLLGGYLGRLEGSQA